MTTATSNSNGVVPRKTLSTQIDRLDSVLDGLAENLDDAVTRAVKEVVAQVVREAVEVAVKEVLSKPEFLRAALAQHNPPPTPVQPTTPKPQRPSLKDVPNSGWNWLCQKATQVKEKVGQALTWCREKLRQGCAAVKRGCTHFTGGCQSLMKKVGTVGLTLWYFRCAISMVLTVGLVGGVIGYCAGPVVSSVLCSVAGMTLTLSGMILLPLWHLLTGNVIDANNA